MNGSVKVFHGFLQELSRVSRWIAEYAQPDFESIIVLK